MYESDFVSFYVIFLIHRNDAAVRIMTQPLVKYKNV